MPLQNGNFTGREGLLTQIAQTLAQASCHDVHPVILTACHGLGGVGKTQLALEYVYRHLQDYTAIYWINAETNEQIELAFYQLAQVLKLEVQTSQTITSMVKHWWETHPGYLIIFDNVEDYAQIEPYLPRVNGHVLITSRYTQWPQHCIVVDVFGREEASAYIQKILNVTASSEVGQLAQMLGYLPLALAQACAFIKQNHITMAKYLEWYATKQAQLLQSKLLPPGDKHLPVYVNWEMTLKVIREKLKLDKGEKLLTFCAYLQHTGIPRQLLLAYLADQQLTDEIEQIELLAILMNYSLLQEDKMPDCYTLHPVMQEVMQLTHDESIKAEWLQTVIRQLCKLYPYEGDQLEDLYQKRQLLPQLERVIKQLTQSSLIQEQDREGLLLRVADGYDAIEGAKQAKAHYEQVLVLQEKHYGPDHFKVAITLTNLGNAYGALGDAQQKKAYLERALAMKEKYYEPDHSQVANTLVNLGDTYRELGDAKQAKAYLERALAIQEKHYDPDHPKVAITLTNLGIVYGALGDVQQQKAYLERALVMKEKHYDPDHPSVAIILDNLGNAYGALGDAKKKKAYLERALAMKEKYYGPDHPEVAITLGNLGDAYRDLGDAQQAKIYLERALAIQEKRYGKDHSEVASTLMSLGNVYFALQGVEQAVTLAKQAHTIFQKHYGDAHRYTQKAKANFEQCQCKLVKYEPLIRYN